MAKVKGEALQLPLREGKYRTKNGRVVGLIGRYPNSWYGRFLDSSKRSGKFDGANREWYLNGECKSTPQHSSWDLVERIGS